MKREILDMAEIGPTNPTFQTLQTKPVGWSGLVESGGQSARFGQRLRVTRSVRNKAALGKADEDAQPCVTREPQPTKVDNPLLEAYELGWANGVKSVTKDDAQFNPDALTERQRIVAFIAARLYPLVFTLDDQRNSDAVTLAGKMLDEVIRQNP